MTVKYLTRVQDSHGKLLSVGDRVRVTGFDREIHKYGEFHGVVTAISDPDGDVNDYGRPVAINPSVSVSFDDGSEDSFTSDMRISGWGDYMRDDLPYCCDDVELV